jgi:hypothetical protein
VLAGGGGLLPIEPSVPAELRYGGGQCYDAMNFAFSVSIGGVDYDVGLSNLIVAGFLFLGPLFVFVMALRGFRAARRALFHKPATTTASSSHHHSRPPSNKLLQQVRLPHLTSLKPIFFPQTKLILTF